LDDEQYEERNRSLCELLSDELDNGLGYSDEEADISKMPKFFSKGKDKKKKKKQRRF